MAIQNFLSDIKLGDSIYIRLGDATNGDLQVLHDGTNSTISNQTGDLQIINHSDDKDIAFYSDDGSGSITEYFRVDGSGVLTFFSKPIQIADNQKIFAGDAGDLQIYHDGANSVIADKGTGHLLLTAPSFRLRNDAQTEEIITADEDGAVKLYYDGSKRFETTAGGAIVTGTLDATGTIVSTGGNIRVGSDTGKFLAGASNDLQIYHDGTNSIINDNGTGNLQFQIAGTPIFDVTSDGITMAGWPESDYELKGDIDGGVRFDAQAGEALSKGDVVYISGAVGDNTVVSKAQANSASTMPAFGLVLKDAANGAACQIVTFGNLYGSGSAALDTSTCSVGDEIFVSAATAGEWTKTAPTGESNLVQKIGKILRVATSNGVIKVSGAGRSNATPNLNTGRLFVGNASNQAVADGTMYVDIANSRVGIGESNPDYPLHISSTLGFPVLIERTNASDAGIRFKDSTTTNADQVRLGAKGNNLQILTGGSESMRVTSDGDVGIGTDSPSVQLDIEDTSNVLIDLNTTTANNNTTIRFRESESNKATIGYDGTNDGFILTTGNFTAGNGIFIDDSQNVGIGTDSPSAKLHIKTTSTTNTNQFLLESTDAGTSSAPDLALYRNSASPADDDVLGALWFYGNNDVSTQELYSGIISVASDVSDGTEDSEIRFLNMVNGTLDTRMTIDGSNVGIGTASPDYPLHIVGTDGVIASMSSDSTNTNKGARFMGGAYTGNLATFALIDGTSGNNVITLGGGTGVGEPSTEIRFNTGSAGSTGSGTERMRLDSSGQLAIGTTTATAPLTVAGDGDILSLNRGSFKVVTNLTSVNHNIISTGKAFNIKTSDSNNLTFLTNNTTALTIDTSQNATFAGDVGIGTSSPSEKLTINGGYIKIIDNSYDTYFLSKQRTDGSQLVGFQSHSLGALSIHSNGSEAIRIDSSQNVGIGTTSPSTKLYVDNGESTFNRGNSAGTIATFRGLNSAQAVIGTATSYFLSDVGIGTTSPTRELEVQGAGNVYIKVSASTDNDSSAIELENTQETWTIRNDDTNNDAFEIDSSTTGNIVTIQKTGNVGIGTASPAKDLVINNATGAQLQLQLNSNDRFRMEADSFGGSFYSPAGYGTRFFTSGSERMRIASDGTITFNAYTTAGLLQVNSSGVISTDTNTYLTTSSASSTYVPKSGGSTLSGGVYNINTNTNTNTLNISRGGGNTSEVMKIGIQDTIATFNYIEDTSNEGNGNFGQYRFILSGNDGETSVNALILAKTNATFADGVRVDNGDLILGEDAFSVSADYVGMKTSHQSGTNDYMIISGTSDGSTYVSSKDGSTTYIRAGGNHNTHQLGISSTGAVFSGDLQVNGNLNIIGNSSVVNVEDINVEQNEITLNYNASSGTNSTADGAGIRIQDAVDNSTDATISWNGTEDHFTFSHPIEIDGPNINGMKFGIKQVTLTENTFTDTLTINMPNYRACYVKIVAIGDWPSHSSIQFLGEYFVHNGGGAFGEPGMVIKEIDNTNTDTIVSQIVDPSGSSGDRDFVIQLKADDTTSTPADATVFVHYEVRGQFNSIT